MRVRPVLSVAAAALAALVTVVVVNPVARADDASAHYYVALGDSLAQGYMPGAGDTNQGYVDDLYSTLQAKDPSLQLVKLGCSGETTTTMIDGGKCAQYPDAAHSQLAAAEQFLQQHAGAVKYLTLDIGANDVAGCAEGGSVDFACVGKGTLTLATNLKTILDGLAAAGSRQAQSVGMTYYDPFLAYWLTGTKGQLLAAASVALLEAINTAESTLYLAHGFKIADVGTAFKSLSMVGRQNVPPYGSLPINVAYICTYTYMCSQQNIHANVAGYQLIADTFARKFS